MNDDISDKQDVILNTLLERHCYWCDSLIDLWTRVDEPMNVDICMNCLTCEGFKINLIDKTTLIRYNTFNNNSKQRWKKLF